MLGGCLVLTTGPALHMEWDDAAARLADALAPVRVLADGSGVPVTVEHTGALRARPQLRDDVRAMASIWLAGWVSGSAWR